MRLEQLGLIAQLRPQLRHLGGQRLLVALQLGHAGVRVRGAGAGCARGLQDK